MMNSGGFLLVSCWFQYENVQKTHRLWAYPTNSTAEPPRLGEAKVGDFHRVKHQGFLTWAAAGPGKMCNPVTGKDYQ